MMNITFGVKRDARKMLLKSWLNFINFLRTAFAPTVLRQYSINLKHKHKKLRAQLTYVKAARRMLVKLVPGRDKP